MDVYFDTPTVFQYKSQSTQTWYELLEMYFNETQKNTFLLKISFIDKRKEKLNFDNGLFFKWLETKTSSHAFESPRELPFLKFR